LQGIRSLIGSGGFAALDRIYNLCQPAPSTPHRRAAA
jgi:hypothetical protein